MIYPYHCTPCDEIFEVTKRLADIEEPGSCPNCGVLSHDRRIGLPRIGFVEVEPAFNPAFGKIIKNKSHLRSEMAKLADMGRPVVEIGDEPVENIHKSHDKARSDRAAQRWAEPVEKCLQDVNHGR